MSAVQQIHGRWRGFSVSEALETLGEDLATIKREDGLTWKDVGRELGKSEDRAADYATSVSEMPVGAFLLGCRAWNGRFAGRTLALIGQQLGPTDRAEMSDNERLSHLLHLAHLLSLALMDDGVVDDDELRSIGSAAIDNAMRGLSAMRDRLRQISARE